jgi:arylsulfatase A-like enzyme
MALYNDSSTKNPRPNVLWILSDQHRAQAAGYSGDPNVRTPNMDMLAATGLSFDNAYSGAPLCCPFRGSLLTGVYPHQCVPGHEYPLPLGMDTLAKVFNEHQYHTFYLGKWHLGGCKEAREPTDTFIVPRELRGGFQDWMGYENNNSQYRTTVHGHSGTEERLPRRLEGYETDALTDLLLDYLDSRRQNAQPFFAVLAVQPPHDPHVAPAEFAGRHNPQTIQLRPNVPRQGPLNERARRDLAGYYAQIENLDYNIGRIVSKLRSLGLYEKTHVIYFSDHGDMHGSNGRLRKNMPYEECARIPFIVSGEIAAPYQFDGRLSGRTDVLLNHVDIAPTTLGLCALPVPAQMRGTDFSGYRLEYRKKPEKEPDSLFMQSVVPTLHAEGVDRPWRAIVTRDGWKYACLPEIPWLLYNLKEDPYEQINLALEPKYKSILKELHCRLAEWIKRTDDPFRLPVL